jgi:hypothetical protein
MNAISDEGRVLADRTEDRHKGANGLTEVADREGPYTRLIGGDGRAAGALARQLLHGAGTYRELRQVPLRTLLPGLERIEYGRPSDRLGTRAANGLINARLDEWPAIAEVSALDLIDLPNFGEKSFLEATEALLIDWLEAGPEVDNQMPGVALPDTAEAGQEVSEDLAAGLAIKDLSARAILDWLWEQRGVSSWAELLELVPDLQEAPATVRVAVDSLGSRPLAEALGRTPTGEADWRAFLALDEREAMIARERILAWRNGQKTLSDLAERLEVTRERVRQVQKTLTRRLLEEAPAPIVHLASRLRSRLGEMTSSEALWTASSELVAASGEPSSDELALRVELLGHLAGPWLGRGSLLLSEQAAAAVDRAITVIALLEPGEPADEVVTALGEELQIGDLGLEQLRPLLSLRELGGSLYLWRGSQLDKAYTFLAAAERPLEFFELHAGVGLEASPRSLAQRLRGDRRFMRRGKDSFGLREWGGEEYSGILEELEQAIERAGGRVDLAELSDRLTAEFDVSGNSVRSYASDRRFVRYEDGTIAMRGAEDEEEQVPLRVASLEDTPAVYQLRGVWHLRIEIDHDVLRGSGRPIRRSVAAAADLEPGLGLGFRYQDGIEVTFSWRATQPTIGSVRGVAIAHGAVEGDLLFLPLSGAEPRQSQLIRGRVRQAETGVRRLAAEVGVDPESVDRAAEEPPLAVRLALGLTYGSGWHDVVDRLRRRRETGLLELVPEVWI